ncbi:protein mono-ADP-ribosyltransferase PARP14-like [Trichomycterus rosablanca]|uniref:protein mono-ADP-ribosyltransferase PARP14-like n=1 Tax=Trichomycterus rosablanca TaxID=2290929 RepID=UPI002F35B7E5
MAEYAHGITVVGDWSSINPKTVQTKLQLYFQSKKKSQGGDCEVQCGDRKATVLFKCQLTRDNVLSKKKHNLTIDNQVLKLNVFELSSAAEGHTEQPGKSTGTGSDVAHGSQQTAVQSTTNEAASRVSLGAPPKPSAVVLENLPVHFSREYLLLFVENLTDVSEENIILEFIPESNTAVITFNDPNAAEMCIKETKTKNKFQQKGITVQVLEQSRSVKVENLPPQSNNEWLELYFEKWGGDVENITIIPEEQAAIVTFEEQEAKKHTFYNTTVNVYIYYQSLGTALYGKNRPTWTLPTPFTEKLHPAIREFLYRKGLISSICNQMMLQHCQVNMDKDEVLLSPLSSLLKRKGITNKHIQYDWEENTKGAFRNILSNFAQFEYSITPSLWPEVEKDIRSTVQDKAFLDMNTLTGNLALAGTAKDINILKPILDDFLKKASSQLKKKKTCISESMNMSPATFFLLQHEGLTHAASKYPQLELDYKKDTNQLIFKGLKFEIVDIKNWILEKQHEMKDKTIKMDPSLLEFLRSMDWEEMSEDLFTSKKNGAVYKFENWDMVLTGSTDKALTEAEKRLEMMLTFQDISLDDPEVVKKPEWQVLTNQMCNIYNSSRKKTVLIKSSNHKNKIIVCGFKDPVLEVSKNLETFINTHSRINEAIRVKSHAVVKFINEKKSQEWQKFMKSGEVKIDFETKKPLIRVYGEQVHVQPALKFLQNLAETLHSEKMTVKKAGVKKFFQEQGTMVLMMKEHRFLVLLEEDYMEDEDEHDYSEGNTVKDFGKTFCEVRTPSGIVITVKMGDICKLKVDAVVNSTNEELQHIGGLSLALLKAAGPSLQQISNQHAALNGKLKPGKAIVTKAGHLPCKCVVHAVGPRYHHMDKSTAVKTLRKAVRESLNQAASNNCTSIAVPTISSGIFGFPLELCTETIAKELRDYTQNRQGGKNTLNEIHLVDNSPKTVNAMTQAVKKEFGDLNPKTTFPQQMSSHQGHGRQGQEYQDRSNNQHGARGSSPRSGDTRVYMDTESEGFELIDTPKRHKPSTSLRTQHKQVLQTQNTQEGLKILLQEGNIQDAVSDVIVNTVSKDLDLSHGAVSSALLQAAGPQIQLEAYSNFMASGSSALTYGAMLVTDGYDLNCQRVFHTVCPYWKGGAESGDEILKRIIQNCLKRAENQKMASISFPAIGTGNHGFPKDLVSNILLREIHAFSSRVQPQNLNEVTVIVHPADQETVQCFIKSFNGGWQRPIITGTRVFQQHSTKQAPAASSAQPTGTINTLTTFLGSGGTEPGVKQEEFMMVSEDFEPVVFQLCGESKEDLTEARKLINGIILREHISSSVQDSAINFLSQEEADVLHELQRELTVSIHLSKKGPEPEITLEGITRDVMKAENRVRDMIRKAKKRVMRRRDATILSTKVEWQYEDISKNFDLEEACNMRKSVDIFINNEPFNAILDKKVAIGRSRQIKLKRTTPADQTLPQNWTDMKGALVLRVPIQQGTPDYTFVENEFRKTGLTLNILTIERIQNETLWRNYINQKAFLERKNNHQKNEKLLFHGTGSDNIDKINDRGFNRSFAGTHGAMFGNGVYFAVDPAYSAQGYAKQDRLGHKRMYLARVLVGHYTTGKPGLLAPPAKSSLKSDLYDSVTNNHSNPTMFVIFHDVHAYPEYLITFK